MVMALLFDDDYALPALIVCIDQAVCQRLPNIIGMGKARSLAVAADAFPIEYAHAHFLQLCRPGINLAKHAAISRSDPKGNL